MRKREKENDEEKEDKKWGWHKRWERERKEKKKKRKKKMKKYKGQGKEDNPKRMKAMDMITKLLRSTFRIAEKNNSEDNSEDRRYLLTLKSK